MSVRLSILLLPSVSPRTGTCQLTTPFVRLYYITVWQPKGMTFHTGSTLLENLSRIKGRVKLRIGIFFSPKVFEQQSGSTM